jgi:DNA-binding transcriptional LysR family regulator
MDTADIEVFLALAEELHFRRTAERLHLSQPRVSRAILELERHAGGKLFERTSRKVQLTPLGALLRDRLDPAYAQLRAAFDEAQRAAREAAGELRIGFTATTQGEALTRLATAFEAGHRDCRALLHEVDIAHPYAALRCGEVDVLVNWLAVDEPDLAVGPAIDYRKRVLAVGIAHPLAKQQTIHIEELADYETPIFHPEPPAAQQDAISPPRTPSGRPIPRSRHVHTNVLEVLADIACGRIIHPTMAGISLFRRDDIVMVPIEGLPPLPIGLIWCAAHENARIRALAATAASIAPPATRHGHDLIADKRTRQDERR